MCENDLNKKRGKKVCDLSDCVCAKCLLEVILEGSESDQASAAAGDAALRRQAPDQYYRRERWVSC